MARLFGPSRPLRDPELDALHEASDQDAAALVDALHGRIAVLRDGLGELAELAPPALATRARAALRAEHELMASWWQRRAGVKR